MLLLPRHWTADGCPVCKRICCCSDPRDVPSCDRLWHCYKKCSGAKNCGSTGAGDAMNEFSSKRPLLEPSEAAPIVNELIEGPPLARPPTVPHRFGSQPLPVAQSTIDGEAWGCTCFGSEYDHYDAGMSNILYHTHLRAAMHCPHRS